MPTTDPPQADSSIPEDPYAESIDPSVSCSKCDAVCCRLTVVLTPEDMRLVPAHFTAVAERGYTVMARSKDGWCVAIDQKHMYCSIYDSRPTDCRRFAMGGPYCRAEREDYYEHGGKDIPFVLRS